MYASGRVGHLCRSVRFQPHPIHYTYTCRRAGLGTVPARPILHPTTVTLEPLQLAPNIRDGNNHTEPAVHALHAHCLSILESLNNAVLQDVVKCGSYACRLSGLIKQPYVVPDTGSTQRACLLYTQPPSTGTWGL